MMQTDLSVQNQAIDNSLGFSELKTWLRHKHPMIFLDRVIDYVPNKCLSAILTISGNMDCIDAHFPGRALFPATHLQQSFCQAAIILLQISTSRLLDNEIAMVGSMSSRFYKAAVPGDTVNINVKVDRLYVGALIFSGEAFVERKRIATIQSTITRINVDKLGKQLW